MNRTIEITAKSEEEAKQIAQGELNENEAILETEVLSAPAKGIFGFVGKQEFKVKFILGEKPAEPKPEPEAEPQKEEAVADQTDYDDIDDTDDNEDHTPERKRTRPERSSRDRRPRRRVEEDIPERPKEPVSEEVLNHPSYQVIFDFIREVADNLGIENLELEDYQRDGAWVIEASGDNVSQIIGKRGKNLDAIQYLMNIVLNRGNEDRIKLVIDAQGYREKRYRNLISLANRMCRKALSNRRKVELEPMSTLDRRTVHMALKDRDDVETFSKGSEPMRKVVIAPAKKRKTDINDRWQPVTVDQDKDEQNKESDNRSETSTAVPMFMEEDV
ncbi:MAG: RNA-binding cell elongation regulator Jag/EloR [Candidatus Rifleibacteriota bacterium]